ncbi:lysylphosphatidylglycerol synthase transmembrane domain-containing protein [Quisquiliibacterium transsilvanicum]|uniref:Flippase-like domain-containing protein n=1 Tax=Quisquiliibacterium transsilvanicum TaxID=1549638 RepID=A0A7W8HGD0_9BURK|nr:lysylphosphatidylglycerol synthase transmembrane domain-containing protein [Quisquiliibacterium transsilvanicum]MBB5271594.1 hypothetical protein [Quisquiliibacterium transsilvanicum]
MKRALRLLRLPAAALLLAAAIALAGPRRVWDALSGADPRWLLAGLACAIAANLVSALRWRALCDWLGMRAPAGWAVRVYFQGVAVNALLPGAVVGGDVLRAWRLRALGHPGLEAGLSVLLDRISGLWMLIVLGALALAQGLREAGTPAAAAIAGAWPAAMPIGPAPAALLAAISMLVLPWLALSLALRAPVRDGAGRLGRLRAALARRGLSGPYALQALLSAAVQLLSAGALLCALRALGADLPAWAVAVAAVPIFLMATLPVSFGGWGTREAAAAITLGALGTPAAVAVTGSVVYGAYALVQALGGWMSGGARSEAVEPR